MPGSDFLQWAQLRLQRLPLQSIAFFTLWICAFYFYVYFWLSCFFLPFPFPNILLIHSILLSLVMFP